MLRQVKGLKGSVGRVHSSLIISTVMSYPTVRLRDVVPRPRYMTSWDRIKHTKIHLFTEMIAEMVLYFYDASQVQLTTCRAQLGVFLYVYAGWPSFFVPEEPVVPNNLPCHRCRSYSWFRCRNFHISTNRLSVHVSILSDIGS